MKKSRINFFSLSFNLLIDLVLLGSGIAVYTFFKVYSFGATKLNPLAVQVFGSQDLAVLIISGLLVIAGAFGLLRTIFRLFKR
jgi:hypothetical protein